MHLSYFLGRRLRSRNASVFPLYTFKYKIELELTCTAARLIHRNVQNNNKSQSKTQRANGKTHSTPPTQVKRSYSSSDTEATTCRWLAVTRLYERRLHYTAPESVCVVCDTHRGFLRARPLVRETHAHNEKKPLQRRVHAQM